MKFIFFGSSKEINLLTQGFDKNSYLILDEVESTTAKAKEGECLVFINFDFNAEQANKLNEILKEFKNIKRIVYSKTRDLKKENISADEYIKGPLNKASFQNAYEEVMGGKTLSTFNLGSKGLESDINKSIQDAFDEAFLEDKPEAAAPVETAPVETAPVETATPTQAGIPPESIRDEESNLEFSIGGIEVPSKVEEVTPEAPVVATPEIPGSSGMTLDDGSAPVTTSGAEAGPGDLEIPSIGEDMPSLELGGAEEIPVAAPVDQGLDLDLDKGATPTAPVVSEPVQQETPTPIKPPAELPGALSDPSMEFTAVVEGEKKGAQETKEFKFSLPRSQEESKPKEVATEAPLQIPKDEIASVPYRAGDQSAMKLEAIIRALREEREALLKELEESRESKSRLLSENLNLEATAEELKVELSIIKRKNEEEFHEDAYGKKLLNEKLRLAEEKNKLLQKDLDILGQKEKIDMNKILQKEKELESQLELLSIDSQNQILIREKKISELKREVDAMEFNMTNLVSREKKLRQEKLEVEEKLNKIMRTMRNSIEFLEEEIEGNQKLFKELKK